MAGSIAVTKTLLGGSIVKYAVQWTADGSGNLNASTFDIGRGRIWGIKFVPGTPAPTTGHTVKLLDPDGADLLSNAGASVSGTAATFGTLLAQLQFVEGFAAVTPTVTGAGALAQATLTVIVGP